MLKLLTLQKKRNALAAKLKTERARRKQLRADETALQEQVDALEEITPELEAQVDELTQQQTEVDDSIADLQDQIDELDSQIADLEDKAAADDPADPEPAPAPVAGTGTGRSRRSAAPEPRNFVCRSRCFTRRDTRDAFYARSDVRDFLGRVRSFAGSSRRTVTGAELTIPEAVLDILRDNLNQYSKLLSHVRLRSVRGHARQPVIGDVPEGVWTEMAGALNNIEFSISEVEVDGYKVGGVIIIDNYLLQDSDINLGEEILYMLGQAIGLALDKAIVYGLGPASKMPVGIVTRLAQTAQPVYWGANQSEWTDLHSSNILKLNLASASGGDFFSPLLSSLAKAHPKLSSGSRIWIMNEATRVDLLVRSLGINSAASIVAGMENTMPIIGGEIITEEFIPDHQIVGGFGDVYLLVEREGASFASSELPMFIQDKTVFKGHARYDGQPIRGEAFVAVSYDNSDVTTTMDFATDYASAKLNSLVVTSAAGATAGTTKLTVAGMQSATNKLKAITSPVPVPVVAGEKPGDDWVAITSGSTSIKAAAGSGATVVELDKNGRAISVGYASTLTLATGT